MYYEKAFIVDTELETDKPAVIELDETYPLEKLSPRNFEHLVWLLYATEIRRGQHVNRFDRAVLMQGTGERGRDVVLFLNSEPVGVIQCKHSKHTATRINRTTVLDELTKLFLHALIEPEMLASENFFWELVTNTNLSESAVNLLTRRDYKRSEIESSISKNKKKYTRLADTDLPGNALTDRIIDVLSKTDLSQRDGLRLSSDIDQHREIIGPRFFRLRSAPNTREPVRHLSSYSDIAEPSIDRVLARYRHLATDTLSLVPTLAFRGREVNLDTIYQPLTLAAETPTDRRREHQEISNDFPADFLNQHRKIIIESAAGMGKSTIVRQLALSAIRTSNFTPIVLEMFRLNDARLNLHDIIANKIGELGEEPKHHGIWEAVRRGNFVLFFDGYDEIAENRRHLVTQEIRSFVSKSSTENNNIYILTSRPNEIRGLFVEFETFSIQEMSNDDAIAQLKKYGQVAAADKARELSTLIATGGLPKSVMEFLRNPLMVCLLYISYVHHPKIPLKRHLFYSQVYRALYEEHDFASKEAFPREKHSKLDIDEFEKVLAHVGFYGATRSALIHSRELLVGQVQEASAELDLKFRPSDFILDAAGTVPVWLKLGHDYVWAHKSLQDYFAAKFIQLSPRKRKAILADKFVNRDRLQVSENTLELLAQMDPDFVRTDLLLPIFEQLVAQIEEPGDAIRLIGPIDKICHVRRVLLLNDVEEDSIHVEEDSTHVEEDSIHVEENTNEPTGRDALSYLTETIRSLFEDTVPRKRFMKTVLNDEDAYVYSMAFTPTSDSEDQKPQNYAITLFTTRNRELRHKLRAFVQLAKAMCQHNDTVVSPEEESANVEQHTNITLSVIRLCGKNSRTVIEDLPSDSDAAIVAEFIGRSFPGEHFSFSEIQTIWAQLKSYETRSTPPGAGILDF